MLPGRRLGHCKAGTTNETLDDGGAPLFRFGKEPVKISLAIIENRAIFLN
jgi:hypothetical protein